MSRRGGRQSRRLPEVGRSGQLTPGQVPGLVLWLRSDLGVTIVQGPVIATGTTPPAVTFAGSPSSSSNTIVLTCTGAGTNTTATFSWTLNGVAQTPFTAAATVVLPATGITATFPAGAYTNTPSADTYTSVVTVSAWADQSGLGHNATQGTSTAQPSLSPTGGPNGLPAVVFSQVVSGQALITAGFTLVQPTYAWLITLWGTLVNLQTIMDGHTPNTLRFTASTTTNVAINFGTNTAIAAYTTATGTWYNFGITASGAASSAVQNGVTSGALNSGVASAGGVGLGSEGSNPANNPGNASFAEVAVFNQLPTAQQILGLSQYAQARYGV